MNKIDQLLLQVFLIGETEELRDQIVQLALYYGIVVPKYTAIIIVVEEPTDQIETEEPETEQKTQADQGTATQTGGVQDFAHQPSLGPTETATAFYNRATNDDAAGAELPLPFIMSIAVLISIPLLKSRRRK